MCLGTAAAVTAGVVGMNVTGALGELTPSGADVGGRSAPVAMARESHADKSDVLHAKKRAARLIAHRKARAAKRAAARRAARQARAATERASRSSAGRTYSGDPRGIARSMAAARYGWGAGEFSCLDSLWERESGWNPRASNASSGAYGIPQALPGSKMAANGSDWQTNPATQIAWGLSYIDHTYGSPCSAWSTSQSRGYY